MLDLLGPAQLFEVTPGWWPAVSTCRALQESVCSRQMCQFSSHNGHLSCGQSPQALLASLLSCGARDLQPPGDPAVKPPVTLLGNPDGRFYCKLKLQGSFGIQEH